MSDAKTQSDPSMEEILATVRRIIAEDERSGVVQPPPPKAGGGDVLVLTQAIGDEALPPAPSAPSPARVEIAAAVLPDGRREPEPPRPEFAPAAARPERLVSSAAADATAAAFARLSTMPRERREGELRIGAGDRTLEDIVRDMLRPLLQSWLDENLPGIVERLVRAEIARVVGQADLR